MSYLIFNENGELEAKELNEDFKTAVHNTLTRGLMGDIHAKNLKKAVSVVDYVGGISLAGTAGFLPLSVSIGAGIMLTRSLARMFGFNGDSMDIKYFKSMYKISEPLQKKMIGWAKKVKGSFIPDSFVKYKSEDVKKAHGLFDNMDNNLNYFNKNSTVARNTIHKATRGIGHGAVSTSTIPIELKVKGGRFIFFLTFDGDSIEDCKLLVDKDYNNKLVNDEDSGDFYDRFKVVEIGQWNSVKPEEYKK